MPCSPDLLSDIWIRTGDIGMLENGHLFVVGRTKEIVKLPNGATVSTSDIEHTVVENNPLIRPGSVAIMQLSSGGTTTLDAIT